MSQAGSLNQLMPAPGTTLFLEGDVGGQVGPNGGGIIFVVGGDNISTVGNPGTNTITINSGEVAYTVTTTNATPTLIATIPVAPSTSSTISCNFTAIQDDFSTAIGGNGFNVAYNSGGGAALSGGFGHQSVIDNSGGFPGISFGVSGNNVQIFVEGVAATTYNWRMIVSTLTSS